MEPYIFALDKYQQYMKDLLRDYGDNGNTDLDQLELEGLKVSAGLLSKRINAIRVEKAIETDPSRKFKYDIEIEHLEAELAALKKKIAVLKLKIDTLVADEQEKIVSESPQATSGQQSSSITHSKNVMSGSISSGGNVHIGDNIVHQYSPASGSSAPAGPSPHPDIAALEAALNAADYASLLALLDAHFDGRPTTQYSILRQHIEHALAQGLMPPPATVQGLRMLINELKKPGR